ncbi:MAG: Fe-S cluster assembly protein SufD [Actinomycetota bacterium]
MIGTEHAARTTMTSRFSGDTAARLSARTGEPAWLADRRRAAVERYETLPWPDQSAEEWKHTDIRGLDVERFDPMPPVNEPVAGLDQLPEGVRVRAIDRLGDGLGVRMDADLVHVSLAPDVAEAGVVLNRAETVARERPDLIERWLGTAGVSDFEAKIEALNAAFTGGRSFLYVPPNVTVALPIQMVRWITRPEVAIFPRSIIVADEGASVTYVDYFAASELAGDALCVAAVEIYAEPGATVNYLQVQDWPQSVWHFSVQRALAQRDATVRSFAATLGGKLSRSVAQTVLDGEGAHAELLGVYFGDRAQHIDNRTLQLHRAPYTSSELYYKGALKGTSQAIYSGLVDIEKEAKQSDARQTNRNLLLSQGASALPDPFLEIKTSDVVRATHAVSVGRPGEDVLFYLTSRGLDHDDAQNLFVKGFFQEIIDRVSVPEIRSSLEQAVEAELALED